MVTTQLLLFHAYFATIQMCNEGEKGKMEKKKEKI
jgi:hypothetical protein